MDQECTFLLGEALRREAFDKAILILCLDVAVDGFQGVDGICELLHHPERHRESVRANACRSWRRDT